MLKSKSQKAVLFRKGKGLQRARPSESRSPSRSPTRDCPRLKLQKSGSSSCAHSHSVKIRRRGSAPCSGLASASSSVHRVGACPWGPQAKIAHRLAKLLTGLQVGHLSGPRPGTWRLMSTCRRQGDTSCLLGVSGLPRPRAAVADGRMARLTPEGFVAGPPQPSLILSNWTHRLAVCPTLPRAYA